MKRAELNNQLVYVYAPSPPTFEGERHRLYCTENEMENYLLGGL
uniref:Uncharacterized protein n=1 Tax=Daucus carota subsp. sativus TaxID=79200 RepID=A0A161WUG9_DAUCS